MNDHQLRIYDSILGLLSDEDNPTPLVRLNRVTPFQHTTVYAKLEWYNPFGAVKDRVAANLIQEAEEAGLLRDGQQLVEPTSGNTGMGLTMMANARGYHLTTPLSNAIPLEKRTVLRFFGSNVMELQDTLCPAPGAPEGAIAKAIELSERPDYHMLNQYVNEGNPRAHYKTTGPEIWKQTSGNITHFVAGLGTCGTITGTGSYLKEQKPDVKVFGVHPVEGHDIPGVRSIRQLEQTKLFRPEQYDQLTPIDNQTAFELCLRLSREESIIAGPSSAMALAGAFEMVPDEPGNIAVVIFPDNAFKYASSVVKHLPQVRPPAGDAAGSAQPDPLSALIASARNPHLEVAADDAGKLLDEGGATWVDVRAYDVYRKEHVPGAINMPLAQIPELAAVLPSERDAPIITVCNRGNMSVEGVLRMLALGYRNVRSVAGGMHGWVERGHPTASE